MTPVIRIYLDEPSITILNASKQHVHNKYHILSLKQIPRDLKTYLHFAIERGQDNALTQQIEGFGGKRAEGFLLKIELCQKRSKFRMQF